MRRGALSVCLSLSHFVHVSYIHTHVRPLDFRVTYIYIARSCTVTRAYSHVRAERAYSMNFIRYCEIALSKSVDRGCQCKIYTILRIHETGTTYIAFAIVTTIVAQNALLILKTSLLFIL